MTVEIKVPTPDDVENLYDSIDRMFAVCVEKNMNMSEVIKASAVIVVHGFQHALKTTTPEEYQALVKYYANISTSTVNFLQDGEIPEKPADFVNGTHKDTVQ